MKTTKRILFKWWIALAAITLLISSCGTSGSLNRSPQQDRGVLEIIRQLEKQPTDTSLQNSFETQYAKAVLDHQQRIGEYRSSNNIDRWEQIMQEYVHLNKLADAVQASTTAKKLVNSQQYDEQVTEARQNATNVYYERAEDLLNNDNREAAKEAYALLQRADKLTPGYKDTKRLLNEAYNKSILHVVVAPVNYYSQPFGYWGLQNDYVQQEIVRDLRFQLGSANVKVYSDIEARSNRIYPDRLIELAWDELFVPTPYTQTFTREVSRQVETGKTADKQPIYSTVKATLSITRRQVQANGNLGCRVTDAGGNALLWEHFPAGYNWIQEFATYRGDSRALGAQDWALINNARMASFSRREIFNQIFRQVYPQVINRLKYLDW